MTTTTTTTSSLTTTKTNVKTTRARARVNRPGIIPCELTPARRAVLEYLTEWRFATTTHLQQELQSDKFRHHTLGDLTRLRQAALVKSFAVSPVRGTSSELGWLLTRRGAEAIGHKYGSNYDRQPSAARLALRDMELALLHQAEFAGWELLHPAAYTPTFPLPPGGTPQYHRLVEALDAVESSRIKAALRAGQLSPTGQAVRDFEQGTHRWAAPRHANDYVAILRPSTHTDTDKPLDALLGREVAAAAPPAVVIIILCPPDAADRFWQSRFETYAKLAVRGLRVWGVFQTEELGLAGGDLFKRLLGASKYSRWRTTANLGSGGGIGNSGNGGNTNANFNGGNGGLIRPVIIEQIYELLDSVRASL